MAVQVELSEEIERPVEVVFRWYADDHVRNHPRWDPNIELWLDSDAPIGLGTIIRRRNSRSGTPVEGTMEIVEYQPNRVIGALTHDGPIEIRGRATFESLGPGLTKLTLTAAIPGLDESTSLPVAGAIVVAFVPRWAEVRERRRTRYAEAVEALVAWAEFPYRVARRVNDDPSLIAALAARGHELQERVAFHESWVNSESAAMGRLYSEIADAVRAAVGPAIQAAWTRPPAMKPSDMNMDAMGIDRAALRDLLNRIGVASRTRFGWRRLFEARSSRRDPVFTGDIEPPIGRMS